MGGTAIWRASETIVAKGKSAFAAAMAVTEPDVTFADGTFLVAGTNMAMDVLEVAALARQAGTPIDTYHAWTREHLTFPNGSHVVEVEIDPETGVVTLASYAAVDDYGVMVNPMIVAGQAHGAMAQGIGQALLEHAVYDADSGQPIAASLMDYALPRADNLPSFTLGFNGTRCTTNPLGVKGCGEAGAIAAFPAIGNAILDALTPLGVTDFAGPATPLHVWTAMQGASHA
jgi:carbon-monoxide dehydrogenase large subunit